MGTQKDTSDNEDRRLDAVEEAALDADLEEVWQDESPQTAAATETADEVDGELGTRGRAD